MLIAHHVKFLKMHFHSLLRSPIAIAVIALAFVQCQAQADDSKSLFNGKDLSGWSGIEGHWSVEDGAITGKTSAEKPLKENTFLVWKGEVDDFELTLKYKIKGGNSGIQYRSKLIDDKKFIVGGYQADIDAHRRFTGINYEERGRGILAERGQIVEIKEDGNKSVVGSAGDADALIELVPDDEWNTYRIVAKGHIVQHYINDHLMSEVQDGETEKAARSGKLAFQIHTGEPMTVQFKDIELTAVKD